MQQTKRSWLCLGQHTPSGDTIAVHSYHSNITHAQHAPLQVGEILQMTPY